MRFPLAIIGSQWGDEGKGKIVDLLAARSDYVVRFNGGNNAGHSVVLNNEKYKLSLIPSGVLQKKRLFLSQGVVVTPEVLISEIEFFEKRKIKIDLTIDPRVNIVMPYHKELDAATEAWKGKAATGSLHLGIGYCYEDRNNRAGIRMEDLINPRILKEKLEKIYPLKIAQIEKVYGLKTKLNIDKIYKNYRIYGQKLKKYVGDVSYEVRKTLGSLSTSLRANRIRLRILFEGAHGTFLDGNFGTYPYTTAVNTISGSIFSYVGFSPQKIWTLGIVKAYTTRVGNGLFPTELSDATGEKIRVQGGEFGTVSKRPRRCGWLDLCLVRTASALSGFDYLAITKLDVLSDLSTIKVCVAYKMGGRIVEEVPSTMQDFLKCQPIYKVFSGWQKDISQIKKFNDLPRETKIYLKFIEKELKVPIKIISVGAERKANILI